MPKKKTAWQKLVAKVRKDNPRLSFKECLVKAKSLYSKS